MNKDSRLRSFVTHIERYIIKTLIALMSLLLILATIELGYTIFKSLMENGEGDLFINLDTLMNVFGVFLLVLIGIELLDTIKVYFKKHVVHVEVVMLVAIIAIARKIIVMDFDKYTGLEVIGIASIIVALSGGYYLIKRTGCGFWPAEREEIEDVEIQEVFSDHKQGLIERTQTIKTQTQESPAEPGRINTGKTGSKSMTEKLSGTDKTDRTDHPEPKKKP